MRGLAAAVLGLALLVSGCSGDPEASPTLPPITSTPTPTVTPVPTPSGMNAPDAFGASAFTRYYFAEVTRAFRALDSTSLRQLSYPECDTCNNYVRSIERIRDAGGRIEGAVFTLAFAEAPPPENLNVVVDMSYSVGEVVEFDAAGREVKRDAARPTRPAQVRLIFESDRWRVRGIREVTPQ